MDVVLNPEQRGRSWFSPNRLLIQACYITRHRPWLEDNKVPKGPSRRYESPPPPLVFVVLIYVDSLTRIVWGRSRFWAGQRMPKQGCQQIRNNSLRKGLGRIAFFATGLGSEIVYTCKNSSYLFPVQLNTHVDNRKGKLHRVDKASREIHFT